MTPLLLSAMLATRAVLGTLTVVGLIAAALRVARAGAGENLLRGVVLLVISGFVWMRPGVKPLGPPSLLYIIALAAFVAGAFFLLGRPAIAHRAERVLTRASFGEACGIALCAMFLALPAIVIPILSHWDASGWMDSHSYDAFAMNIATGKAPGGYSSYMPVYQYGLACVYYTFGHFFFVQQLVNGALALIVVALLSLAAWTVFQHSGAAALVAGMLGAYTPQLFAAVHTTQIEAWYMPLVCAVLLAWAIYWRRPSIAHARAWRLRSPWRPILATRAHCSWG